ncbi:HNH endonuclease, partial [Mycobacterium sp. C31M]
NLHPMCREHHVLKTHYGWTPVMEPDGTICWTAPTGHVYRTAPGAAILFPDRRFDVPVPRKRNITPLDNECRGTMLPTRRRTRAQTRTQRITAERTRNREQRARQKAESNSDPPPY